MIDKTTKVVIGIAVILLVVLVGLMIFSSNPEVTGNVVNTDTNTLTETKEPVKIGLILPLTEVAADIGKSNLNAFDIAVKEINDNGGINGRPIELVVEDSKGCDGKAAVTAMHKLIEIDKVPAVYSACSGVALATHPIAEANKVVHFSCASNPKVTDAGDYMFRICPADDYAGRVAAKYTLDKFNAKKVAILSCDNDWCVGLRDSFKQNYLALGGQIVAEEQVRTDSADVRTALAKIKASNPELVYFPGYPVETIAAFKQAKELGLNVPFFGGDAWTDKSIPEEAGASANNKYYTTPASSYSKAFEQKVNGDLTVCTPEAYDAAYILANTMKKVGTDPTAIKNELYKLRNYQGESGTIGLDENGDLMGGAFDIKTFKDGEIVDYDRGIK